MGRLVVSAGWLGVALACWACTLLPAFAHADGHEPRGYQCFFSSDEAGPEAFCYALVDPGRNVINAATSWESWKTVRGLLSRERGEVLWFRLEGRDYVARDAGTLVRAHAIVAPMQAIGEREAQLDEQQEALERRIESASSNAQSATLQKQQAELEARQEAIGREDKRASRRAGQQMQTLAREAIAAGRVVRGPGNAHSTSTSTRPARRRQP